MLLWSVLALILASDPLELGTVAWHRDFDASLKTAAEEEKSLLVLFQEVPG